MMQRPTFPRNNFPLALCIDFRASAGDHSFGVLLLVVAGQMSNQGLGAIARVVRQERLARDRFGALRR